MKPAIGVFAFILVSTAVLGAGSRAQEKPAAPDAAKAPLQLAISSQGQKVADADIVLTLVHSGGGGQCGGAGGGGMPACEAADHWQANVTVRGKGGAEKTSVFALRKKEDLRKHLEGIAARKIRIKHPDREFISEVTLSLRVGPQVPYGLVQQLLATAAKAGLCQIEFAVVPGGAAAEQRLAVPLPLDEKSRIMEVKAAEGPRIAVRVVNEKRECERQIGTAKFATGEAGDVELRVKIEKAFADKKWPAIIAAEKGVPWQAIVSVVDACQAAGRAVLFAGPDPGK